MLIVKKGREIILYIKKVLFAKSKFYLENFIPQKVTIPSYILSFELLI